MSCQLTGCRNKAEFVRRGVIIRLPGHAEPVNVGDLKLCPSCERKTRAGGRTSIANDVITAALARR